jgi:two-component system NtrC family response regulator
VRELENALERAVILAGSEITPRDLPLEGLDGEGESGLTLPRGMTITQAVEELELRMIQRALAENNGVAAHAARALGVTKSNLAYKMKKYGL